VNKFAQKMFHRITLGVYAGVEYLKGASFGLSQSQTLDYAGKACWGQTFKIITNICKLRP
jgi:hypothetical protein